MTSHLIGIFVYILRPISIKRECNEENNEKCVKLGKNFFHKSFMQSTNAAHVICK